MDIHTPSDVKIQIYYGGLLPGFVAVFEELETMHYWGYNRLTWKELDYWDRVEAVAFRRVNLKLSNIYEYERAKKMKRKSKR